MRQRQCWSPIHSTRLVSAPASLPLSLLPRCACLPYRHADILQLPQLRVGPFLRESVGRFLVLHIEQCLDRVMHGRPWCECNDESLLGVIVYPSQTQGKIEDIWMTPSPRWIDLRFIRDVTTPGMWVGAHSLLGSCSSELSKWLLLAMEDAKSAKNAIDAEAEASVSANAHMWQSSMEVA